MLILTRRDQESLFIGDEVIVDVLEINGNQVKLGITAPRQTVILRAELLDGSYPEKQPNHYWQD